MPTIAYPAHLESDVVLRNGRTLRIRTVRPDDAEGLKRMFGSLSTESLYSRFFDLRTAEEALRYSPVDVDYVHDFGVVGQVGEDIIAVAHYFAFPRRPNTAECAFTIADRYHGCGIGTKLLEKLAEIARTHGITQFEAEVLPENQRMLDVFLCSGFGETGAAGREAELRIVEKVRAAGIRMVGPNCMGVINTDANVRMHATFSSVFPPSGNVAMSSQSGALGLAILDYARSIGIGFSTFISVGNKADVSGNDLIQYWAEDPNTDVMLLYLESFGNPRKFGEIARRVGRKKPIVAVKAGRSASGARAASSHTGALAQSDAIVRDLFKQAGVIRTDTLEELFDIASLLANQPLPIGRRVAIMTNAGGPGILAADACEAAGLTLSPLSDETTAALRAFLPSAASVGNPIDMIASATPDHYARTLKLLLADPNVDSVLIIYIPVLPT